MAARGVPPGVGRPVGASTTPRRPRRPRPRLAARRRPAPTAAAPAPPPASAPARPPPAPPPGPHHIHGRPPAAADAAQDAPPRPDARAPRDAGPDLSVEAPDGDGLHAVERDVQRHAAHEGGPAGVACAEVVQGVGPAPADADAPVVALRPLAHSPREGRPLRWDPAPAAPSRTSPRDPRVRLDSSPPTPPPTSVSPYLH